MDPVDRSAIMTIYIDRLELLKASVCLAFEHLSYTPSSYKAVLEEALHLTPITELSFFLTLFCQGKCLSFSPLVLIVL